MSFTYKWEKVCNHFEKYSIDELRRLAELEGVHVAPSMIKREICALLTENRVTKEQRQCEIQQSTLPTCTNETSMGQEKLDEIPPHLFYSFEQDGQIYCDNVRDWKALLLRSQTNPYTRSPFPPSVHTDILEKNKYLDAALLKKCGNELDVEISRAFPNLNEEDIPLMIAAGKGKFHRFVKILSDKDVIDRNECEVIASISNLNNAKITLCYILQNKFGDGGYYSRVYYNYFTANDVVQFNPNISSLFEPLEDLIMRATPVQFNRFVNHLGIFGWLPPTLSAQKRYIIASSGDYEASRIFLEAASRPAHLSMIQRNRIFATFLATSPEMLTELDCVTTEQVRDKCLSDDTCIETFNQLTLVLERRFHCENKFQKCLTNDEVMRCMNGISDYSIFRNEPRLQSSIGYFNYIKYKLTGQFSDETKNEIATLVDNICRANGFEFLTRMI